MSLKQTPNQKNPNSILLQLRLKSKDPLNPLGYYEAYEQLGKALANHPTLKIEQVEFRIEREDYKTSI